MAKYLVLWEADQSRMPVDVKERVSGWNGMLQLVKKDIDGIPSPELTPLKSALFS